MSRHFTRGLLEWSRNMKSFTASLVIREIPAKTHSEIAVHTQHSD